MLNRTQKFGRFGEDLATRSLVKKGYQIICRNYRTQFGEIDIVAKDADTIVFIEVKSRRTPTFGHPKYAVTGDKQERISKAALYYLKMTNQSQVRARFDVVTISEHNQQTDVEIIKNAFELAYK
ncbi:MAG: YraN family protein [Desulfobacteraceae bacterium]|nr:MAG: YraN family protein [Desulfobacteraceae bacterium]